MATNTEVAARLGLAHSTVSRMRTGERVGSVRTLRRLSREFEVPLEELMSAADSALDGDKTAWVKIMTRVVRDEDAEDVVAQAV